MLSKLQEQINKQLISQGLSPDFIISDNRTKVVKQHKIFSPNMCYVYFSHCLNLMLDDFPQQISVVLDLSELWNEFSFLFYKRHAIFFHTSASGEMNLHWHTHVLKKECQFYGSLYLCAVVFAELSVKNSGKLYCILTFEADTLKEWKPSNFTHPLRNIMKTLRQGFVHCLK